MSARDAAEAAVMIAVGAAHAALLLATKEAVERVFPKETND